MSGRTTGNPAAFSPRAVLGLLVFGALAFLATLYFIGAGENSEASRDGGAHAASKGLAGYAALSELLEARGDTVRMIRNSGQLEDDTLLILTPPHQADGDEINRIIRERRYNGPTILILPKWVPFRIPRGTPVEAKDGWVLLLGSEAPDWAADIGAKGMSTVSLATGEAAAQHWSGLELSGTLPAGAGSLVADASEEAPGGSVVQTIASPSIQALISDENGNMLAGYWDDNGYYPELAYQAGVSPGDSGKLDEDLWPVVIVAEPDLMNNYGMADRQRAMAALALVDATLENYEMPLAFDLTLNGQGRNQNLLTLAFTPPFLAATLCLILAAIVVAWRAMRRFGPPLAETPVFAFGKRQLARNVAALIQRSRRLHLLGAPYAAIMRMRVAHLLGLRTAGDPAQLETTIDTLLARRGIKADGFAENAEALRRARSAHELLRRANALKQIERKLAP